MENHIDTIVNGVNFKRIANAVIDVDQRDDLSNLPYGSVIWCKTEFLDHVFDQLRNSDKVFKLITHCSDFEIDESRFLRKPKCILKWYAQNVNYFHRDLIPIPIGLENHSGPWRGSSIDPNYINNLPKKKLDEYKVTNKVYCNFNIFTNSSVRLLTQNRLKELGLMVQDINRPYSEYCDAINQHLFVASPRGNGIDCHRTWEALLMGSIPIVEKHFMYDGYNLPIIQIDSWATFTPSLLDGYIDRFVSKQLFQNTEQLYLTYWENRIKYEI